MWQVHLLTAEAEDRLEQVGYESWVVTQRRKKWRWAKQLATKDPERWAARAAAWNPVWHLKASRPAGRPKRRWAQDIVDFLGPQCPSGWLQAAKNESFWDSHEDAYTKFDA